jgi:hypothetical protein
MDYKSGEQAYMIIYSRFFEMSVYYSHGQIYM